MGDAAREAFLESAEYAAVAKVLPFCRLWGVPAGRRFSAFFSGGHLALKISKTSSQSDG